MPRFYNPYDWYWVRNDGVIYSSKRQAYITANDQIYADWCDSGCWPTSWPRDENGEQTDPALQDVLTPYGLKLPVEEKAA